MYKEVYPYSFKDLILINIYMFINKFINMLLYKHVYKYGWGPTKDSQKMPADPRKQSLAERSTCDLQMNPHPIQSKGKNRLPLTNPIHINQIQWDR